MKREDILRSLDTKQLTSWHDRAETSGGNRYTFFDSANSRTLTFTVAEIVQELSTRDDQPAQFVKKKKK